MARKGEFKKTANARSVRQRKYQSSKEQKTNRAARNQARQEAMRDGKVSKGDGKEVDHKRPFAHGGSKSKSNTRILSASANKRAGGRIGGQRKAAKGK